MTHVIEMDGNSELQNSCSWMIDKVKGRLQSKTALLVVGVSVTVGILLLFDFWPVLIYDSRIHKIERICYIGSQISTASAQLSEQGFVYSITPDGKYLIVYINRRAPIVFTKIIQIWNRASSQRTRQDESSMLNRVLDANRYFTTFEVNTSGTVISKVI